MSLTSIHLNRTRSSASGELAGLSTYLKQLIGEPFRLVRVSYGDELTVHFGDLEPAGNPLLKGYLYGAYILGSRGSPWLLKSGPIENPYIISADDLEDGAASEASKRLSNRELESGRFIEPESRVLEAVPFIDKRIGGFGLQLRMSDGSTLVVLPSAPDTDADEPGDVVLPQLADWELSTPHGLLKAGPDLQWSFEPRRERVK